MRPSRRRSASTWQGSTPRGAAISAPRRRNAGAAARAARSRSGRLGPARSPVRAPDRGCERGGTGRDHGPRRPPSRRVALAGVPLGVVLLAAGVRGRRPPSSRWRTSRVDPLTAPHRDRPGPDPQHPELAADARRGPARARVPRRGPARLGGAAGPVHDPGALAARGDRDASSRRSRTSSRRRSSTCAPGSASLEDGEGGIGRGRAQLNDDLAGRAHRGRPDPAAPGPASSCSSRTRSSRCAGRDSEADYLVGARDLRTVDRGAVARPAPRPSRSTASGSRPRAPIIDIGSSILVNSAYLVAAVPDHRARAEGPVRAPERRRRVRGLRPRTGPDLRHPGVVRRAGVGRRAGVRGDGLAALLAPGCEPVDRAGAVPAPSPSVGA